MGIKRIALDAGHGLYTSGKQTPTGIKEWTLNDKVRDKVVAKLSGYNVQIIHTDNNEGNTDEGLTTRRNTYVNQNVDVFVSIHHNAYTGNWNSATGVEVYTDKNYTSADEKLAQCIYKRLVANTGMKGRGVKRANWTVINQNKIPAVLVEGGFMDGSKDYNYIISDAGQEAYAQAVADGLIEFLGLTKTSSAPAPAPTPTKLSLDEVARKVMNGEYGNGAERRQKLEAEGYDYDTVQNRVNELLKGKVSTPTPAPAPAPQPAPTNSFLVKVKVNALNIRSGAGVNNKVVGCIRDKGTYTIVATAKASDGGTWGKLKSGAGWINISSNYVTRY